MARSPSFTKRSEAAKSGGVSGARKDRSAAGGGRPGGTPAAAKKTATKPAGAPMRRMPGR